MSENLELQSKSAALYRGRRRWPFILAALLLLIAIPAVYYSLDTLAHGSRAAIPPGKFATRVKSPSLKPHSIIEQQTAATSNPESERLKEQEKIWGTWVMNYYGPRYLEIRPDNTARIVSFPDMMAQMILGTKRLEINCKWTRDGDRISFQMNDGVPAQSFEYVTKTWGNALPYEFVSLSDDKLTFKDLSDGKLDVWSRAEAIPDSHLPADKKKS